jgi:hypothetical protein
MATGHPLKEQGGVRNMRSRIGHGEGAGTFGPTTAKLGQCGVLYFVS